MDFSYIFISNKNHIFLHIEPTLEPTLFLKYGVLCAVCGYKLDVAKELCLSSNSTEAVNYLN